jgi:hypothetical protein
VEDLYLSSVEAYANGDIERTVALCRQALEIDPTFEPAQETLASAQRMLTLQRQMESIRLGEEEEFFDETLEELESDEDGEQ